jgi:hypothetical protein
MKKSFFLILLFILFYPCAVLSQSFYRVQYGPLTAGEDRKHDGFVVLYADGSGLLRMRITASGSLESVLAEAKLQEQFAKSADGSDIENLSYYITRLPRTIKGNRAVQLQPVKIWFKLNESDNFFEPFAVSDAASPEVPAEKNLDAILLNSDSLKKDLVLNYFLPSEELFKTLFATRVRGLSPAERNSKLRLHIVANTNDKSIGFSCRLDMLRVIETFTDLTEYLGIGFELDTLAGDALNRQSTDNSVQQLKSSDADILVFYYTGHGFRKKEDRRRYPYMDLRGKTDNDMFINSMNIEDIYNTLRTNTKARLKLVLSDCCNAGVDATNATGTPPMATKSSGLDWNEENIKKLFFNSPRSILMTSADMGQLATGNSRFGGFFSYFFRVSLEGHFSILKKNVSWDQVLTEAKKQTKLKADNTCCAKPCSLATVCKQEPTYIIR